MASYRTRVFNSKNGPHWVYDLHPSAKRMMHTDKSNVEVSTLCSRSLQTLGDSYHLLSLTEIILRIHYYQFSFLHRMNDNDSLGKK